jgi:crossover junction endodeoxyribonuclease RuvC
MILGIDPGLANTGFAIVSYEEKLIDSGCIVTEVGSSDRLGQIYERLDFLIKKFKIKEIAIESLYFAKNEKSASRVAEAIGMIKTLAYLHKLKVFEYSPLKVKMCLTGYGRADKSQVELMVKNILGIDEDIKPSHASDAVAIALTHLSHRRFDSFVS